MDCIGRLKHMGALEETCNNLLEINKVLYLSKDNILRRLPKEWLKSLLDKLNTSHLYILRRSTGYASGFVCLLKHEHLQKSSLTLRALSFLYLLRTSEHFIFPFEYTYKYASGSTTENELLLDIGPTSTTSWKACVHALNVLKLLVHEIVSSQKKCDFMEHTLAISIIGFLSHRWVIRNSAMMLLATSLQREITNDKRTFLESSKGIDVDKFLVKYMSSPLNTFLSEAIKAALTNNSCYHLLFAVCLLFAKFQLRTISRKTLGSDKMIYEIQLDTYLELFQKCHFVPNTNIRKMSSQAICKILHVDQMKDFLVKMVNLLFDMDRTVIISNQNALHGRLIMLSTLFELTFHSYGLRSVELWDLEYQVKYGHTSNDKSVTTGSEKQAALFIQPNITQLFDDHQFIEKLIHVLVRTVFYHSLPTITRKVMFLYRMLHLWYQYQHEKGTINVIVRKIHCRVKKAWTLCLIFALRQLSKYSNTDYTTINTLPEELLMVQDCLVDLITLKINIYDDSDRDEIITLTFDLLCRYLNNPTMTIRKGVLVGILKYFHADLLSNNISHGIIVRIIKKVYFNFHIEEHFELLPLYGVIMIQFLEQNIISKHLSTFFHREYITRLDFKKWNYLSSLIMNQSGLIYQNGSSEIFIKLMTNIMATILHGFIFVPSNHFQQNESKDFIHDLLRILEMIEMWCDIIEQGSEESLPEHIRRAAAQSLMKSNVNAFLYRIKSQFKSLEKSFIRLVLTMMTRIWLITCKLRRDNDQIVRTMMRSFVEQNYMYSLGMNQPLEVLNKLPLAESIILEQHSSAIIFSKTTDKYFANLLDEYHDLIEIMGAFLFNLYCTLGINEYENIYLDVISREIELIHRNTINVMKGLTNTHECSCAIPIINEGFHNQISSETPLAAIFQSDEENQFHSEPIIKSFIYYEVLNVLTLKTLKLYCHSRCNETTIDEKSFLYLSKSILENLIFYYERTYLIVQYLLLQLCRDDMNSNQSFQSEVFHKCSSPIHSIANLLDTLYNNENSTSMKQVLNDIILLDNAMQRKYEDKLTLMYEIITICLGYCHENGACKGVMNGEEENYLHDSILTLHPIIVHDMERIKRIIYVSTQD